MAAISNPTLQNVIADLAFVFEDTTQKPVLDGSITFDTGGVTTTEVKLTTKQVCTSTIDKDDSDISYDVVVSMAAGATQTDNLVATKSENVDVTFVTRSKNAKIALKDATVSRSYQMSNDGVLVHHTVVTPSAAGMIITIAESGSTIEEPTNI